MMASGFCSFEFNGKRFEVGTSSDGLLVVRNDGAEEGAPQAIIDVNMQPPGVTNLTAIGMAVSNGDAFVLAALAAAKGAHRYP